MIYMAKNDETGYYLRTCGGCDETDASGCVDVYRGIEDGDDDVVVVFLNKRGCLCRTMEAALLLFFSVGSVLIQCACSRWIGRIRGWSFRSCRAQGCGGCPADSSGSSLPGC